MSKCNYSNENDNINDLKNTMIFNDKLEIDHNINLGR